MIMFFLTFWLANLQPIPSVKRPNNGPPTAPNIDRAACKTPPSWEAINAIAMQRAPTMKERILVMRVSFLHVLPQDSKQG